jgi:hypothetical protein
MVLSSMKILPSSRLLIALFYLIYYEMCVDSFQQSPLHNVVLTHNLVTSVECGYSPIYYIYV